MMKRVIFFLLIFFSLLSEVEAQENIYIYRNDGMFNAFSKSDVDSIEYSKYDENGILGEEWKMQLIYTADSIYSIPLAVIDSVSFYAPQTILNNNVFMLTASHDQYLSDADTLSFVLASTTPAQMVPKKGNIVFSTVDCLSFEHGIMARVVSKQNVSDGIKFDCEKVALDDIYDQIVAYGELKSNEADLAKAVQNHAVGATFEKNFTLWNRDYEDTLENGGTKTDYGISDAASAKFTVCKILGKPMSVTLEFDNQFKSNVKFNATSSVGQYYAKKLGKTINCGRIPIPNTGLWIVPKLDLYAYFEEVGKISLDFAAHLNRMDKFIIKYCDKQWSTEYKPLTDAGIDVASLSMKGYAEIGVNPQILFSLCGSATGIGINYKVGLRENIDFEFDAIKQFDSGTYDALKDSYARTTIPQEFSVFAQAGLIDINDTHRYEHKPLAWEPQWGSDKYIFPIFTTPTYTKGNENSTAIISTTVSRDLLMPVEIGLELKKASTLVETQILPTKYQYEKDFSQNMKWHFENLQNEVLYEANVIVKMQKQIFETNTKYNFSIMDIDVHSLEAKSISYYSAILQGSVKGINFSKDTYKIGFLVSSTDRNPTIENAFNYGIPNNRENMSIKIGDLDSNTAYYWRIYLIRNNEIYYGEVRNFKTLERESPFVGLMQFYKTSNGELWHNTNNWGEEGLIDKWYGVNLNRGTIVNLSLNNNNLSGTPLLKDLALNDVNLTENQFERIDFEKCIFKEIPQEGGGIYPATILLPSNIKKVFIKSNTFDDDNLYIDGKFLKEVNVENNISEHGSLSVYNGHSSEDSTYIDNFLFHNNTNFNCLHCYRSNIHKLQIQSNTLNEISQIDVGCVDSMFIENNTGATYYQILKAKIGSLVFKQKEMNIIDIRGSVINNIVLTGMNYVAERKVFRILGPDKDTLVKKIYFNNCTILCSCDLGVHDAEVFIANSSMGRANWWPDVSFGYNNIYEIKNSWINGVYISSLKGTSDEIYSYICLNK